MSGPFNEALHVRTQIAFWTSAFWLSLWIVLQTRVFLQETEAHPSSKTRVWTYRILAGIVCLGALNYTFGLIGLGY